jgi:pimeloyl-ACP methyl ester carboxylesterase
MNTDRNNIKMKELQKTGQNLMIYIIILIISAGCSTPVGVKPLNPQEAYRNSMAGPLSEGTPGYSTTIILNRFDLADRFEDDPVSAITKLHEIAMKDNRRDLLFALSELAYINGEKAEKSLNEETAKSAPDYFLLAAVYSYFSVLDTSLKPLPSLFDHRVRNACDLYNYSLWRGLSTGENGELEIKEGTRTLPVGKIEITVNPEHFPWALDKFEKFEAADRYAVHGLSVRNRTNGIGMPVIAIRKALKDSIFGSQAIPASIFLKPDGKLQQLKSGNFKASLELYSSYEDAVINVNSINVPVETDTTTATAYKLSDEAVWSFGVDAFLGKLKNVPSRIYRFQPYNPDRIPVIFVHGTFSRSEERRVGKECTSWNGDSVLRKKYQFWYFFYNSSRLITISANDLRSEIQRNIKKLDPENRSEAMKNMVVIGHSQGGLLTKMTAIDTGDSLLKTVIKGNLEDLKTSEENRRIIMDNLVIKPVPSVKRVVFISTPHRGSFLSQNIARNLIHGIIEMPVTFIESAVNIYNFLTDDVKRHWQGRIPTSVDAMSPDDPLLNAIAKTPLATGVKGNSIIAVEGEGPPELLDDGVVEYKSAHIEGMESEFIVHSGHSCQDKPSTIEEVRRILLKHLEDTGF